jgi:hypothetical protein
VHLLPRIDLKGFVQDARGAAPDARVITPDYFEVLCVPSDASRASLDA